MENNGACWGIMVFGKNVLCRMSVWWSMMFGTECWFWGGMVMFSGKSWCLVENDGVGRQYCLLSGEQCCLLGNYGVW